jgi:hypothetical protein
MTIFVGIPSETRGTFLWMLKWMTQSFLLVRPRQTEVQMSRCSKSLRCSSEGRVISVGALVIAVTDCCS